MSFIETGDLSFAATTAYEAFAYFPLRDRLFFDACADIQPTNQTHRGNVVTFVIYNDIAPNVTPLAESTDVTPVTISDSTVTVTLNEYGNAAVTTAAVRGQNILEVNEDVANIIGYNAGLSFDSLARNPLVAGSNVRYGGGSGGPTGSVTATDLLTATDVRFVGAQMAENNVQFINSNRWKAFISPLVSHDLREETGPGSWREPHTYVQTREIWNGEIGDFESFSFIETSRLSAPALETAQGGPGGFVDGGSTTTDVHPTLFLGKQALAKTWSTKVSAAMPQIILGEVTDRLRRFVPIGWYWMGGYGRFREESLYRVESASSIGDN